jgi:hypothetical protein
LRWQLLEVAGHRESCLAAGVVAVLVAAFAKHWQARHYAFAALKALGCNEEGMAWGSEENYCI